MTDPGELGDEARRLLAGVQEWTRRNFPAPPSGHGGPECQWCPLCQLAAALRGEHPELTDLIAQAGAAVANAVRVLGDSATARKDDGSAPTVPPPPPRRPRPRVEHVRLDDTNQTDGETQ